MEYNQTDNEFVSVYSLAKKPSIEINTVEKAMQGDKEAFSILFMQTYRPMYLVVRRFLERDEDIYDALQNGYARAYKYLPRLQAAQAFLGWLKKIMENAARDIRADITGRAAVYEDMEAFVDEPTMDDTEASERRTDIGEVLSCLEPRQAEVLTLHYYDGMKLSEIARFLNEPPSTVRSRFAQAKKTLVERLKVKGIDKSLYSGSVSAMIAVSLRSIIGTDVLSAATAQQMLDDILEDRQGHLGAAAYKLLEAQRNRAILKAVSLLMTLTVVVTCVTVALLNGFPWKWLSVLSAAGQSDPSVVQPTATTGFRQDTSFSDATSAVGTTVGTTATSSTSDGTRPGQAISSTSSFPDVTESISSSPAATIPSMTFIPDYRPGKANTVMRNPCWRASMFNTGREFLDWQDEWVYCFKDIRGAYKFRRDGTGGRSSYTLPSSILAPVVWGDWIYYELDGHEEIQRVRTDGAVVETLAKVSGGQEIFGFVMREQQLLYAVWQMDAFGVPQYQYRAYSLVTGKDELLPVSGDFGFYKCVPVGDWFLNTESLCAYSFYYDKVDVWKLRAELEGMEAGNDWQTIKDNGYFPVCLLEDKIYITTGHCIDFSGDPPRLYQAVSFRGSPIRPDTIFQVEFVDEINGRLAVTLYDDTGVYPESMQWYSEKDGWGEELPGVLLRSSKYQTYQSSGDGTVFSVKADGTWFSCRLDGSGYREYHF